MSRFFKLLGSWSLYLSLVWVQCFASTAFAEPTRHPIPPHVTQIAGYPFPAKLAGLQRGHRIDYNEPGQGFSVRYEAQGDTWADIYIYDLAEDLASMEPRKASIGQREQALGDIERVVSAGSYQSAKLIDKSEVKPFAKAHVSITQKGTTRDSYVFVTISRKKFVKIRLTTSATNADQIANRFSSEYARVLTR